MKVLICYTSQDFHSFAIVEDTNVYQLGNTISKDIQAINSSIEMFALSTSVSNRK